MFTLILFAMQCHDCMVSPELRPRASGEGEGISREVLGTLLRHPTSRNQRRIIIIRGENTIKYKLGLNHSPRGENGYRSCSIPPVEEIV